jgi:ferredoxin
MKAKITDACVCCGTCVGICPVGAISLSDDGSRYAVDPNKCIGCGVCVTNCPVDAILKTEQGGK